jgi:serine/threonine-protein kinase
VNPRAYEFYLRGRQAWDEGQFDSFKRALGFFQRAIALDSTYAPPYAGVADCYWALSGGMLDPREACPQARAAAERALRLDETLAEAHTSLGTVLAEYYWDWPGADRELRRAVELKPSDASAHRQYSFYYRYVGDYDRDREELHKAIALDPLSGFTASQNGWPEYFTHRFPEALSSFQQTRTSWPNEFFVTAGVAMAYEGMRDYPHAISTFEEACRENRTGQMRAFLAHACGLGGQPARARAILDTLLRNRSHEFVSAVDLATVYTGLGQRDSAVVWFERGVDEHSDWMQFLKVDPRFDPLRNDARFQAVEKRVGLLP